MEVDDLFSSFKITSNLLDVPTETEPKVLILTGLTTVVTRLPETELKNDFSQLLNLKNNCNDLWQVYAI